jgi:glyoxylase-like metal-dependent hydrolase (beta-lactamase superfamily II)
MPKAQLKMEVPFDRSFEAPYGEPVQVSPLITRLLAPNPGPFTFRGTGVAIIGGDQVAVIDPGPDDPAHLEALRNALRGKQVSHILVTHTHRDHSPAARALKQWTGAPTYGFGPHPNDGSAAVEEGADRDFTPGIVLRDGDLVKGKRFTLDCVHTPGHTSNHLCYALKEEQALFSGDHVMGWSTTVVAPPDGDMTAYIASLEKLLSRDDAIYWPTHGGAIRDPRAYVTALLRHRLAREAEIFAALNAGLTRIPAIVQRVYCGLDPRLQRAAELNVLAHLVKLIHEGSAVADGAGLTAHYGTRK